MSSFTDAILIDTGKKREGRKIYRVVNDFYWEMGFKGSGLRVYARAGYETDGPSRPTLKSPGLFAKLAAVVLVVVPEAIWKLAVKPSIIHDVLREDLRFTLTEGNCAFLCGLEAVGMSEFWRNRLFDAVCSNSNRERSNPDEIVNRSVGAGCVVTVAR